MTALDDVTSDVTSDVGALDKSRHTIAMYERVARRFAAACAPEPAPFSAAALRRLAAHAGPAGTLLEIGSGPGRDADYLESIGARVRRTDVTQAFIDLQAERGRVVDRLDMLTDDFGGPYDGVLALETFIHVDRGLLDGVLDRVMAALRPGGALLVSVRDGDGEQWQPDNCHLVFWRRDEFAAHLLRAGFTIVWDERHLDEDDRPWFSFFAIGN